MVTGGGPAPGRRMCVSDETAHEEAGEAGSGVSSSGGRRGRGIMTDRRGTVHTPM